MYKILSVLSIGLLLLAIVFLILGDKLGSSICAFSSLIIGLSCVLAYIVYLLRQIKLILEREKNES